MTEFFRDDDVEAMRLETHTEDYVQRKLLDNIVHWLNKDHQEMQAWHNGKQLYISPQHGLGGKRFRPTTGDWIVRNRSTGAVSVYFAEEFKKTYQRPTEPVRRCWMVTTLDREPNLGEDDFLAIRTRPRQVVTELWEVAVAAGRPVVDYDALAEEVTRAGAEGGVECLVCGSRHAHGHSGRDMVIFRNGIKYATKRNLGAL